MLARVRCSVERGIRRVAERQASPMTDLMFLAILVAFFALAAVFVRACEHIIGPDLEADVPTDVTEPDRAAA